jgi:hypothetical protein
MYICRVPHSESTKALPWQCRTSALVLGPILGHAVTAHEHRAVNVKTNCNEATGPTAWAMHIMTNLALDNKNRRT